MSQSPMPDRPAHTPLPHDPTRRRFLAAAATAPLAVGAASRGHAMIDPPLETDPFTYEIQRTEAEWRARLSPEEYEILRDGWTELPRTSALWNERREGNYGCRGCGLHVYSSNWQVPIDKGWVFFAHAEPTTVMMSIDGPQQAYGMDPNGPGAMIEVHCRRCGSHLGHILIVEGKLVHCINGAALTFTPASV
ncbi:MAG: peptide-methionine (R)-S-oxide reductase [Pseudomonadota bacterium]